MNRVCRAVPWFLLTALIASGGSGVPVVFAQSAQPPPDSAAAEVRQVRDAAAKAIDAYRAAGGPQGAADHPAIEWSDRLWTLRDRNPRTDAALMATSEAVWLLVRAELWDRAHARIESVGFDDPAWARLVFPVYNEGSARNDFTYAIATLTNVAARTATPAIKSVTLLHAGRAERRRGDLGAANAALEAARDAAPGTPSSIEAAGVLYEIAHLGIGMPAPAIAAKTRSGKRFDLAAARGKPVVLVFWAST